MVIPAVAAIRAHALHTIPTGGIPLVGRQAAARRARAELARPIYHPQPSLPVRILRAITSWLGRLYHSAQGLPGGWWALVTLTALLVIVAAIVLARIGPLARAQRRAREFVAPGRALSAADHRSAAARLAEAGDFAGAICERVRAIAAELDERGVLRPVTGRTADEFAAEAGQAMPPYAADLRGAALLFDEVRYGQRAGSRPGYDRIAELDTRISASAGRAGWRAVQPVADGVTP